MRADERIEGEGVGVEGGEDNLLAARATGWITQGELPGGTTIVDACNGFKELIRLVVLWTV